MQRRTKVLAATGTVVLVGSLAIAGATLAYGGKWRGHGYGHHGKHHIGAMLKIYDSNDDGKLTQEEIDSGRTKRLTTFDSDVDQQLTLEEYQALWLDAMRNRMVDRFQHLDEDGDGRVTLAEFNEPTANLVADRDRNGDGALDREDRKRRHHHDHDGEDKDEN